MLNRQKEPAMFSGALVSLTMKILAIVQEAVQVETENEWPNVKEVTGVFVSFFKH
jgi:hypothetical protein